MTVAFTIHSSVLPQTTRLAGFHGSEGLSRLYRYDVFLVMPNDVSHDFDVRSAVGTKATLRMEPTPGAPPFHLSGVIASMQLVNEFQERATFHAVIVPRFWLLTQSRHSRMFTNETIPAILTSVLDKGGLAGGYALQLLASYPSQEHVCQYHESDFDFVSRWMEREGMYYWFEQDEDSERLVIADDKSTHHAVGGKPVRYLPHAGDAMIDGALSKFTCRASALPGSVRYKDYDYARPTFEISGQAEVSGGVGQIFIHHSRFFTPDEGAKLARVTAESLRAGEVVFQGSGGTTSARPGYFFELDEHPRAAFNAKYLATEVEHWVNQLHGQPDLEHLMHWNDVFRTEVTAIPATVQYRAPQKTPWPRIYGGEHAVVDGPTTSEYAQIDAQGRYAVKFQFDESDLTGGKASTWVRMVQPHGGTIEGFHFPLRAGTEVVCAFTGGDCDRPYIAGVVPNTLTPSPVTSGNNTKNIIQTGGRNRLEIEDRAGAQRITLSTPFENSYVRMGSPNAEHTMIVHTDGPTLIDAGQDLDVTAGANKNETITGNVTEIYKAKKSETVTLAVTEVYENTKDETVTDAVTTTYKASEARSIGTTKTESIGSGSGGAKLGGGVIWAQSIYGDAQIVATGSYKVKAHQDTVTDTHGNSTSTTHGDVKSTVDGTSTSIVNGNRVSTTEGDTTSHTIGAAFSFTEGISISNFLGGSISATEGITLAAQYGPKLQFTGPIQFSASWGTDFKNLVGLALSNTEGGKLDIVEGFKIELHEGVKVAETTIEALDTKLKAEATNAHLANKQLELANKALDIMFTDLQITA